MADWCGILATFGVSGVSHFGRGRGLRHHLPYEASFLIGNASQSLTVVY